MKTVSKFFDELTTRELYEILKSRMEIFVVEQKCVYQDFDDIDLGCREQYAICRLNSHNS